MFKSLKEKLFGIFKKPETTIKKSKTIKKTKKGQTKTPSIKTTKSPDIKTPQKKRTKEVSELLEDAEEIQELKKQVLEVPKPPTEAIISYPDIKDEHIVEVDDKSIPEKKGFFSKLVNKISSHKLTKEEFENLFEELELILLENNVALEAVDKIRESLEKDLIGLEVKKSDAQKKVQESLKKSILSILLEPPNLIEQIKSSQKPYVILFFGINGTGKTTSIAKIAHHLKKNNISVVLAAADTFRAASIEQLQTHANKLKIPCISHQYNSDPSAVAFDAIKHAKSHNIDVVLIDTAGRMYTRANLLKEMEKIIRISKPNLKIFVGESITGNDAIEQARTFNESAGIDGIILSKADIDEKAGTILSVSHVTKKPIFFLGTGQEYSDLLPFTKSAVLKNLGLD